MVVFTVARTDGALYCFVSRDLEKMKMLRFDVNGWCMYYCRLAEGCFKWEHRPDDRKPVIRVDRQQLMWLLDGLSIGQDAPAPITATSQVPASYRCIVVTSEVP